MENVDLSEISGSEIRTALLKLVEKKVKSKNIKVRIEPGSKKGKFTSSSKKQFNTTLAFE